MISTDRVVFFVNPGAADGRASARLRSILAREPGFDRCRTVPVTSLADADRTVRESSEETIAVAVGGDGTVNLLARALRNDGSRGTLAVLPLGVGNAFAHSIGVDSVPSALETLRSGRATRIDVMASTHPIGSLALVSLSFGFESSYITGLSSRRQWQRIGPAFSGLLHSWKVVSRGLTLITDGEPFWLPGQSFFSAGLYNMPCYAFGRRVLPNANPRDGMAEAVVYTTAAGYWKTVWTGLKNLPPGKNGTTRWRPWTAVEIESDGPIQYDGESCEGGRFEVKLEPAAIRVLVPRLHA